jgi:hypothetical protein
LTFNRTISAAENLVGLCSATVVNLRGAAFEFSLGADKHPFFETMFAFRQLCQRERLSLPKISESNSDWRIEDSSSESLFIHGTSDKNQETT